MVAAAKQMPLSNLVDPEVAKREAAEEQAEIEAGYVWRTELMSAIRRFVGTFTSHGLEGVDAAAYELNKRWEPEGRPVTPAALSAALRGAERNNFRAEWLDFFAWRSKDVAELMGRRVKPAKTKEELFDDFLAELEGELAHKRIQAAMRRAIAR